MGPGVIEFACSLPKLVFKGPSIMCSMRVVLRGFVCGLLAVAALCRGAQAQAQSYTLGAPVLAVPATGQPVFVATADVNGDGIPDLIYIDAGATPSASTTHVLLGDGKGGFKESAKLQTAGNSVGIGNLAGSGHVDIAWLSWSRTSGIVQSLAPGNGDGTFGAVQSWSYPGFPISGQPAQFGYLTTSALLEIEELGPGVASLLAEDVNGDQLYNLLFEQPFQSFDPFALSMRAGPVVVSPLNRPPLVITTGQVGIFIDGAGSSHPEETFGDAGDTFAYWHDSVSQGISGALSLLVKDMNGDGIADLMEENAQGRIEVFAGNGDGTFSTSSIGGTMSVDDTQGDGGHLIVAADLDGDQIPDLLAFSPLGVSVELGTAGGNFDDTGSYPAGTGAGTNGQFVTADFNGDGALDVAMDAPGGIVILYGKATGSTGNTLTASPEPSAYGGAFTLTATLAAGAGGTVEFAIDGATLGTSNVGASGTATWQVPAGNAYAPGVHAITGSWLASGHALAVQITGSHTILAAATGTVNAGGATAFEAAIPVSATIATASGLPAPTGTVTFSVPGATSALSSGAVTLVNGNASYTFPGVAPNTGGNPVLPGSNTVTAVYSGDTNYGGVTLTASHVVNLGVTTVTLTPAPPTPTLAASYFYGQPINGYVNFTPQDAQFALKGTWEQLSNGVGVPGCTALAITGSSCPYGYPTLIDAGNYVWVEQYNGGPANGDPVNGTGDSTPYTFVVEPDTTTASALSSSMNPAPLGTAVTFTVTLTGNAAVPTGTVQFLDGTTPLGTGTLNAAGQASFTTSTLTVGTHPITAVYAATLDFNGATSAVLPQLITAVADASAVTLTSSVNPSIFGQPVTFTAAASVPGPFPFLIQSGTMTFLDGATVIGTGAINQFGRATFTTSALAVGSHAITASYPGGTSAGGQTIAPSVSAVLTQVVDAAMRSAPPGFTLTVTPNPVTLKPGNTGILLVTVTALSGFSQPVALSCTGTNSSNQLGCGFIESTIPMGGGATTLDLVTTAPYPCGGNPTEPYAKQGDAALVLPSCGAGSSHSAKLQASGWGTAGMGGAMLAGLVWIWPKRRRRWASLLAMVILAGVLGLSGCGNCTNLGTTPGNYEVTVVATAGNVTQSVVVKVDVLVP